MKAVVVNSMVYSLPLRCSFARGLPWDSGKTAEDWIWGKGACTKSARWSTSTPSSACQCHIHGDARSGVTRLDRKMLPPADPANHEPFAALEKAWSL
jgi:hypothetical protein